MDTTIKRMSIREFRRAIKSKMPLPVVVYSDGELAFWVVAPDMLKKLLARPCPHCGKPYRAQRS